MGVLAFAVFVGILFVSNAVSILNREATQKNLVEAQQRNVKSYADKAWKVVAQQGQVAAKYAEDFKEVYPDLINGRYQGQQVGDGALMKWIVEHNPQFDTTLYAKLMDAIESQRGDLVNQQEKLIDMNREHNIPFDHVWSGIVLNIFGREKTEITLITSDKTDEIFKNGGKENDINVFGDK